MDPDYKTYTLSELYDVKRNIDRERYPQRYELLLTEIKLKEKFADQETKPEKLSEKDKATINKVILTIGALFCSLELIYAFINGYIKLKGEIYHLSTNPQGFYIIVLLYIIFIIVLLYGVLIGYTNKTQRKPQKHS